MPIAFKEWAVTVRALAEGEQLLTLRKGGIREENKHFEIEHDRFFLYPTFDHQRNDLVRESHMPELGRALEEGVWPDGEPPLEALTVDGGIPQPDRVRIRAWAEVVQPAEPRARPVEVLASLGLGADAPLQHRVARRDGAIVGAASFFTHGDTVLGQQLAVVASEQRVGIGRALAQACAREALPAGARVALVEPTPDTVAFYRLLGFALRPWPRDRSFYLPLPRG